jgi:hypothetical protein
LFYSSVAGVTVSPVLFQVTAEPLVSVTFRRRVLFQLHQFLVRTSQKVLQQLQLLLKIKLIDLEASSFDGITNYFTGSELVSTIAKLECLLFENVFSDIHYK